MALKERYYTVDGQIVGYKKGGVRKDFLTDALGSVTAEVDQTGNTKTFDGRYQPYGGTLSSTGSRGTYGWVGTWGYRETGLSASSHYVRARHFSQLSGSWTVVDQFWPDQLKYTYVRGQVCQKKDPSGNAPIIDPGCGGSTSQAASCCKDFSDFFFPNGKLDSTKLNGIIT